MILEVFVWIECLEVHLNWHVLCRSVLVDEEFDVRLRADKLSLFLHDFRLTSDFRAEATQVLHHLLQIVLHEIYAGFLELLQFLQVHGILALNQADLAVKAFYRFLVCLRGYLSLVLDSNTFLADFLDLDCCKGTLFVLYHRVFNSLLLFDCLLFQAEESVTCFLVKL